MAAPSRKSGEEWRQRRRRRSRLRLISLACALWGSRHDKAQVILVVDRSRDVHRDANHIWRAFLERHFQPRGEDVVTAVPVADALHFLDVRRRSRYQSDPVIRLQSVSGADPSIAASCPQRENASRKNQNCPCPHIVRGFWRPRRLGCAAGARSHRRSTGELTSTLGCSPFSLAAYAARIPRDASKIHVLRRSEDNLRRDPATSFWGCTRELWPMILCPR